jgi:alanine racemase
LRGAESQGDWIRPGLALYGASPFAGRSAAELGLAPVMTLETAVIALREVPTGEGVGYGAAWRAVRPSRIAILAAGYADGLPRHLPSGSPVLFASGRAPLAGRVSMDMVAVDVTDLPTVTVGERVVLWGRGLPVDELASAAGTIAYELLCAVAPRVPRVPSGA